MIQHNVASENWFLIPDIKRKAIMSKWNVYRGDGSEIIKAVYERFKKEYGENKNINDIRFGIYHGGSWVISVTIKWSSRNKVKLSKAYHGFIVQIFYGGIPASMMRKEAKKQFEVLLKEMKMNHKSMVKDCEEFKNMPENKFYEMIWLMNGMSKHYNPFKK
jgi:hypothetical protein